MGREKGREGIGCTRGVSGAGPDGTNSGMVVESSVAERVGVAQSGTHSSRRLRRRQYASVQELWKRDRRTAINRVLGGGRDLGGHTLQEITDYWGPVFEAPSTPWSGDVGRTDEGWTAAEIFAPVDNVELETTLIPKVPRPPVPGDYRPLTITSVIVRHFYKLLAGRLSALCKHEPAQRGFVSGVDGVGDSMVRLNAIMRKVWQSRRALSMVSLDVAKAFDSVSHVAIVRLLGMRGAPPVFVRYVESCLARSSLRIRWRGQRSRVIRVMRGVRQGDPLSPFLFNLVMDRVLSGLPERVGFRIGTPGRRINAMAYADDMLLFASTEVGMRLLLMTAEASLADCGLGVNSAKSWSLSLIPSGRQKLIKVDTSAVFRLGGLELPAIGVADSFGYLGVRFGPSGVLEAEPCLLEKLDCIQRAPLKPQQNMEALRDFVLPGVFQELVLGRLKKTSLSRWDVSVRGHVRRWLHLPHDVPNTYIHAPFKYGGLGVAELSKLVPVWRRIRRERVMAGWGEDEAEELGDGVREFGGFESVEAVRQAQKEELCGKVDGSDLKESEAVRASYSWKGLRAAALSGREYVQFVRLHAGCLPSATRTARGRCDQGGSPCWVGCQLPETVAHVIQLCPLTKGGRILRHHAVVRLLAGSFERRWFGVYREVVMGLDGACVRPDLIVTRGSRAWIVDVQIVSPGDCMGTINQAKIRKYDTPPIHEAARALTGKLDIGVVAVTVTWKGIWCSRSARDLREMGVTKLVLEWITERVLRGSHMN